MVVSLSPVLDMELTLKMWGVGGWPYLTVMFVQAAPHKLCAAADWDDDCTGGAGGSFILWRRHYEDCCA